MLHLVTGGAGFIGSTLVDALLARGDEVVVLDDFNDFYDPELKRQNIAEAAQNPDFHLVEGDIGDPNLLDETFQKFSFDRVIHLAARAGVRPSINNPELYYQVNCQGTLNVLEACRNHEVKQVIFGSSSSVYGSNRKVPFSETDFVDHPVSPYAATKKAAELLAHTYVHLFEMHITCLRFFTVYGPRQRPEMAIHHFMRCIDEGVELPLFGDGTSSRDYTYVEDIVAGVISSLDKVNGFRVYNLGNAETIQLADLIHKIGAVMGKEPRIKQLPFQPGDVMTTFADITRAKSELGYRPKTSIDAGLANMFQWYRKQGG